MNDGIVFRRANVRRHTASFSYREKSVFNMYKRHFFLRQHDSYSGFVPEIYPQKRFICALVEMNEREDEKNSSLVWQWKNIHDFSFTHSHTHAHTHTPINTCAICKAIVCRSLQLKSVPFFVWYFVYNRKFIRFVWPCPMACGWMLVRVCFKIVSGLNVPDLHMLRLFLMSLIKINPRNWTQRTA